jgi:hypothetical protein
MSRFREEAGRRVYLNTLMGMLAAASTLIEGQRLAVASVNAESKCGRAISRTTRVKGD